MSETTHTLNRTWAKRDGYYTATNGDCSPTPSEWTQALDALETTRQQLTEAQLALAAVGITEAKTLAESVQRTVALLNREFVERCDALAAELEAVSKERDDARLAARYESDMAAQALAELEAVRMVDSLLVVDGARLCYSDRSRMVQLWNDDTDDGVSVLIEEAASIPALGRALAAQEAKG